MILIIDEDKRKRAYALSDELMRSGMCSIVTDSAHAGNYPEAMAAVVYTPSEAYLNKVCVMCGRTPVLSINESGWRIYNKDVIFYDDRLCPTYCDFVFGFLSDKYGITEGKYTFGALRITDDGVMIGLAYLKLTKSEKRILTMLAVCDRWVSENTVLKACFRNAGKGSSTRVPVHICNINKKAKEVAGRPIILTKRGVGYRIDRII